MINKIAFISYSVADLQQSILFYRDLLGLKLLFIKDTWAEFDIDGQRLAIHEESERPPTDSGSTVYFEANPIEEMVEKLQSKGVIFHGKIAMYPYGKLILFNDPDGNPLGLYEPPG